MTRYILRRLAAMVVTLWFIVTATFVIMHAIPGDPFVTEARLPETVLANLRAYYGTDRPLGEQYVRYLGGLVRFDLGPSFKSDTMGVNEQIGRGFPVSAQLGLQALALALVLGLALGMFAASRAGGMVDGLTMLVGTVGISVPSFVIAPVLIDLLAVRAGWLPVATWGSFAHTIMPTITLAVAPLAYIARLTRASVLETLGQDYIRTAHAKGQLPFWVLVRHALPNALIPIVTILGPITAGIMVGSFVIEYIFGIPGTGRLLVRAIFERDYPVILGSAVFFSTLLVGFNLLVDLAYGVIDPRIRVERSMS